MPIKNWSRIWYLMDHTKCLISTAMIAKETSNMPAIKRTVWWNTNLFIDRFRPIVPRWHCKILECTVTVDTFLANKIPWWTEFEILYKTWSELIEYLPRQIRQPAKASLMSRKKNAMKPKSHQMLSMQSIKELQSTVVLLKTFQHKSTSFEFHTIDGMGKNCFCKRQCSEICSFEEKLI